MSITLHHLRASRSARIFWVLEELGLKYDVEVHDFGSPEWDKLSPFGKAPILTYKGQNLTESAPIILRLLADHPSSNVQSDPTSDDKFWSYFSEGSLMLYVQPSVFIKIGRKQLSRDKSLGEEAQRGADAMEGWVQQWSAKNTKPGFEQAEKFLQSHEYFSGTDKPGLGDFMLFTVIGGQKSPAISAWKKKIGQRPAYQRAMARMREEEEKQKAAKKAKAKL